MASVDLEYNQGFKIYKGNTWFNNLVLHKATYETVVMSLGDKISGIVYYKNNKLVVDMTEYIMYKNVKYVLVNPPTVIKEGLVSDNGELKGMTKYSFTFYHPMYMLSNFPFSDVAVDDSQKQYLSQNKTFSWIGNLTDYVAKLNKNLEGTQWKVSIGTNVTDAEKNKLSEVLSFDNNTIADALKTAYETWEIPYIVDKVEAGTQDYLINGKRFIVQFGLPSNKIYEVDEEGEYILDDNNQKIPFVFKYGQGVGLKNNSRTPKNNKIVTRIAGYGSEDNIPYGYPQIVWTGNQSWNYTINNDSTAANSYPIYDGIVGGQKVRLIKHPFTRTHLMPSIYSETVNKKVNPNATGYDPNTELVDYYDADDNTYPNQIKAGEPSYEIHEFEDIKPEFDPSGLSSGIYSATPYDGHSDESITQNKFLSIVDDLYTETDIKAEKTQLNALRTSFVTQQQNSAKGTSGNYEYDWSFKTDGQYKKVKYASSGANFEYVVNVGLTPATIDWDDTMDEQGKYVQSYFKVTIPALGFDLYASAAITQEMTINMRSGACIGCSFPVMVDWDDYKRNFYDKDGNFAPNGTQRNYTKYPNSTNASITLILQKETNTFGTLMPNIYQKPARGDKFVILGISLPTSYITTAEGKLETEMKKYMRDNNVYYYEYPLKFDEHFLISNEHILSQMKPNVIVNFEYADVEQSLYIKQMSIKYNESPLPKYDITLTDDVDVVLNKIGEAIAEYRGQRQYGNGGGNSETLDGNKFLRKDINDTASGTIRMLKGLQVGERFVTGLLGEGGIFRKDDDGTTYLECDRMYVRMKAYFDTVEVRRFLHSGGNRIASAAGMKCSRVEYIAANGSATRNVSDAVKFRCYFRAEDNGAKVTNDFVVGDLAYCKETNIDTNLSQHGYWRAVVGVSSNANSSGEHWIDLSKSDCSPTLNDVPIAQDDIIQLGNKTAKARQGAIVEYVSGEDAPSYQIYQGINTYNLDNKNYIGLGYSSDTGRAYMNVYGDMYVGDKNQNTYIKYEQKNPTTNQPKLTIKAVVEMLSPSTGGTTTLDDFASAVTGDIDNLQSQIDGQIETWFYDYDPAVNNAPASNWTTVSEKDNHLGDLFYNTTSGYAWRWGREETAPNVYEYKWYRITDVDVVKALADAAKAQDTADHKRRVFTAQPYPPYDVGDLWSNAIFPANNTEKDAANNKYYKDLLTCKTAKAEGGSFAIADWSLTTNYTDDTALTNFVSNTYAPFVQNIQGQVDQKAETWYQDTDPSTAWTTDALKASHVGDIWCDTSQNGGKKTYIWKDFGTSANPRYAWAEQAVPDAVFDKIDGKADIFVSKPTTYNVNDMWIIESGLSSTDMPTGCQSGDIVISSASRVNNYQKTDWSKKDRYTDDTKYNNFISALLNGMPQGSTEATVEAALNAIKAALNQGTTIGGGLVLTTLIGLRDSSDVLWSGISGAYDSTQLGNGIAAWYGGAMVDIESLTGTAKTAYDNLTPTQKAASANYAKTLFRFDGSGYLASTNIRWTADGKVYLSNLYTGSNNPISNLFFDAFAIGIDGSTSYINPQFTFNHIDIVRRTGVGDSITNSSVLNYGEMKSRFVSIDFFNRLFQAYSNEAHTDAQKVNPNDTTTTINNLKILVGAWTDQYLSALGLNSQSGGGGVGDVTWDLLASNSDTHQIAASHLNVLSGYATQTWVTSLGYITQTSADNRYIPLTPSRPTDIHEAETWKTFTVSNPTNGIGNDWHQGYMLAANSDNRYKCILTFYGSNNANELYIQTCNNNNWGNWRKILTDANYTSYVYSRSSVYTKTESDNRYLLTTDISSWAKASTKPSYTLEEVLDGTTRKLVTYTFETGDSNGTFKVTPSTGSAQNVSIKGLGARAFDDTNYVIRNDSDYKVEKSIYSIGSCRVFTGNRYTDTPTSGRWVSGLVLGSNWDDNHYQAYLVESENGRWYTTRAYENNLMKNWNQFAYVTDNVASATKLQTSRSIWGQSFDGTANVDGKLTINSRLKGTDGCADYQTIYSNYTSSVGYSLGLKNVYNANATGYGVGIKLSLGTNRETNKWVGIAACSASAYANDTDLVFNFNGTERVRFASGGNVGIGTTSPSGKLHVVGNSIFNGSLTIGYGRPWVFNSINPDTPSEALVLKPTVQDKWLLIRTNGDLPVMAFSCQEQNGHQRVGICTEAPTANLHVSGNARITGSLQIGEAIIYWDTQAQGLRVTKGLFSEQWISALGANSGGSGGGGGGGDVTWELLASNSDTRQIAASHLNVLSGYATQTWVTSQISGKVSRVDVGTTQYSPSSGIVSLPAYPSTLDDIADGSTRKLANYLPLTGGTMIGEIASNGDRPWKFGGTYDSAASIGYLRASSDSKSFRFLSVMGVTGYDIYFAGEGDATDIKTTINHTFWGTVNIYDSTSGRSIGSITANYIIKRGGTSSQFLKADGSVDSNTYALSSSLSGYLPLAGGTMSNTNLVSNLNADKLDGQDGSYYATATGLLTVQGYFTNGVANSAAKLSDTTAKTAWGQTFFTGGTPTSISNAPLSGVTNIDSLLYFDTTNSRIGIGVSSPSSALDVNGKVTIKNENGYAIEAYGQLRFNASTDSTSHPQRVILGCFNGTGSMAYQPFIRFRGNDNTVRDFAYMDDNNDYKVGAQDKAIYLYGRNVNIFSRANTTDDTVVLAMKAISYGRIFIGNSTSNYSPINNTDCNLIVRGNQFIGGKLYLYRPTANSDSGAVWIEYDTNAGAVKLNGNFYATGAVSALGAGTGGGGSTGDFSAIVNSLNQSSTAVGTGFLYSNGGAWSFKSTSLFWKTTDFDLKTALSVFGDYDNHGATNLGWIGDVEDDAKVVTSSMLAYWDGCYSGTSSNLTFCVKGMFGDIVTKNLSSNIAFTGNIGIGDSANSSYKLYVNGNTYLNGVLNVKAFFIQNSGPNYYNIGANGITVYQNGTWTGGSDIRRKDIVTNIGCDINQIASAPIFDFIWKADITRTVHVGTSAQYWSKVFENAVSEGVDGYLYMDYGATALASAVITARKVLDHEGRIRLLEIENQALRKEIEQLKKAA